MKIVLDTNVVVSGTFWRGSPLKILQAVFSSKLEIVITEEIFDEYTEVLTLLGKKYKYDPTELLDFIKIQSHWNIPVKLNNQICQDPDDDKFIACAVSARVKTIISDDKLLLNCSGYHSIDIISPGHFVQNYLD